MSNDHDQFIRGLIGGQRVQPTCYLVWWEESEDVGGVGLVGVYRSIGLARHVHERLSIIAPERKVHMAELPLL